MQEKGGNVMKETLEKLWDEYLSDECATIETEEKNTY